MADLCAERPPGFDIGFLSKEQNRGAEHASQAGEGTSSGATPFAPWRGSGAPSLLVGLAPGRSDRSGRGGPQGNHGGSVPACPLGLSRRGRPVGDPAPVTRRLPGFRRPPGVVPFPEHRSSGEERAWARRLSKRFGCESRLDDRTFVLKGDGSVAGGVPPDAADGVPGDPRPGEAGDGRKQQRHEQQPGESREQEFPLRKLWRESAEGSVDNPRLTLGEFREEIEVRSQIIIFHTLGRPCLRSGQRQPIEVQDQHEPFFLPCAQVGWVHGHSPTAAKSARRRASVETPHHNRRRMGKGRVSVRLTHTTPATIKTPSEASARPRVHCQPRKFQAARRACCASTAWRTRASNPGVGSATFHSFSTASSRPCCSTISRQRGHSPK